MKGLAFTCVDTLFHRGRVCWRSERCDMNPSEIRHDAFSAWLRTHETVVFERPGACFDSPLARWLQAMSGHIYGIENGRYGRACWDAQTWLPLPRWAMLMVARFDACATRLLTATEVLSMVAEVQQMGARRVV